MPRIVCTLALAAMLLPAASLPAEDADPAIAAIDAFIATQTIPKQPGWKERLNKPPKVEFTAGKTYKWRLDTTEGPIVVKLLPRSAPMHVSSTIYLTRVGFYDNVVFHRIIPGFMAQGGDPTGTGRGGPGYQYAGEFDRKLSHSKPGMLSMANAGPNTDGSQFFLTFVPTPFLDGKHTLFGEVVGGKATLDKFEAVGTPGAGRPTRRVEIKKATITVE